MELSQLHHLLFFSRAIPSLAFYGQLSPQASRGSGKQVFLVFFKWKRVERELLGLRPRDEAAMLGVNNRKNRK